MLLYVDKNLLKNNKNILKFGKNTFIILLEYCEKEAVKCKF
jgi:hypothetical protein